MTETENWKPIDFQCTLECTYCPEKGYSETPRLNDDWESIPRYFAIWVSPDTDIFCEEVPDRLINLVMERASQHSRGTRRCFIFCTKNTARYHDFLDKLPQWAMLVTTVESDFNYGCSRAPPPAVRLEEVRKLKFAISDLRGDYQIGIAIQPIMDFTDNFVKAIKFAMPDQVSIGRELTGLKNFPEPSFDKVMTLARSLSKFTEVNIHSVAITPLTTLEKWPPRVLPHRLERSRESDESRYVRAQMRIF